MSPGVVGLLSVVRYILMLGVYGGFTTAIVGIFLMEGPEEIWGDKAPPVSPAVQAMFNLTIQFFTIYLVIAICRTIQQLKGSTAAMTMVEEAFTLARRP